MICSAAELQLQALSDERVVQMPDTRLKTSDIPRLRRLLNLCILISDDVMPASSHVIHPALDHPD